MSAAPLPDSWDDKAFAEAHRRLREQPSALSDADLGMFSLRTVPGLPNGRHRPCRRGAATGR